MILLEGHRPEVLRRREGPTVTTEHRKASRGSVELGQEWKICEVTPPLPWPFGPHGVEQLIAIITPTF